MWCYMDGQLSRSPSPDGASFVNGRPARPGASCISGSSSFKPQMEHYRGRLEDRRWTDGIFIGVSRDILLVDRWSQVELRTASSSLPGRCQPWRAGTTQVCRDASKDVPAPQSPQPYLPDSRPPIPPPPPPPPLLHPSSIVPFTLFLTWRGSSRTHLKNIKPELIPRLLSPRYQTEAQRWRPGRNGPGYQVRLLLVVPPFPLLLTLVLGSGPTSFVLLFPTHDHGSRPLFARELSTGQDDFWSTYALVRNEGRLAARSAVPRCRSFALVLLDSSAGEMFRTSGVERGANEVAVDPPERAGGCWGVWPGPGGAHGVLGRGGRGEGTLLELTGTFCGFKPVLLATSSRVFSTSDRRRTSWRVKSRGGRRRLNGRHR